MYGSLPEPQRFIFFNCFLFLPVIIICAKENFPGMNNWLLLNW